MRGTSEPDLEPDREVEDPEAARRSVLRTDGVGALAVLVVGVLEGRADLLAVEMVAVAAGICVATAAALYAVEHDLVPGLYPEVAALAMLVGLVGLGAGLALALPYPLLLVAAAVLVGFGIGVLAYRTVFGVVRPVPRSRLKRV